MYMYKGFQGQMHPLMEKKNLLKKILLYYRKLYYMKNIFSTKLEPSTIHFSIRKLIIFFILILVNVIEYE